MNIVTCTAPVNIAVIKYWGKRDEKLILPTNDSISVSLDMRQLCAKTTVMASPNFECDRIWLNGREESMTNPRLRSCLQGIKERAVICPKMENWKIHICSKNNFPTAAGLASSAAGYACLAAALTKLYRYEGDISELARQGSGSACRSVFGGFVRWYMGSDPTGSDSIARQIAPASHWPEMRIIVLVVSDSKKKISSAIGMQRTLQTSELIQYRIEHCVPKRVEAMHQAIIEKNFEKFAELTMKDSNQMHAACLDAYPPCIYLNDVSHKIIHLVHSYNRAVNGIRVAYTNDAGPNTVLYLEEKDVPEVLGVFNHFMPPALDQDNYIQGNPPQCLAPSKGLLENMDCEASAAGLLQYIIYSGIGEGPTYLNDPKDHLLNEQGLPIVF